MADFWTNVRFFTQEAKNFEKWCAIWDAEDRVQRLA